MFSSLFREIISHFTEVICGYMPADSAIMIYRLSISHRSQTEEVQSGWVNCKEDEKLGGLAGAQGTVDSGLKSTWQLTKHCFLGLIVGLILFSIFRPRHQKRMHPVFQMAKSWFSGGKIWRVSGGQIERQVRLTGGTLPG